MVEAPEIWRRLCSGISLDGLGLPTIRGRTDLRTLAAPEPVATSRFATANAKITRLGGLTIVRGGRWNGLDFSGAPLNGLRFFDCTIEDCVFDRAACADWRMWGTAVSRTSFRSTNLRNSALGGIDNGGKRNSFDSVDFSEADLRETIYVSADMFRCRFSRAKLTKIDFQGTVFVDCVFEGKMDEVQFYRHSLRDGRAFPPNEMRNVDLRGARLSCVEFRNLDMDTVLWPEGDDHFVIQDFPQTLDRLLATWGTRSDVRSKQLAAWFGISRKWVAATQKVGVISKADLIEAGGPEAVADFLRILGERPPIH
jgi:uncharacterized protein YjbI with pentapeptide repeats